MIEDVYADDRSGISLVTHCVHVFTQLRGLNAVIVMDNKTHELAAVKNVSPLVLGRGDGGYFLASDAIALVGHVSEIHYLEDGQVACLSSDGLYASIRPRPGSPRNRISDPCS